MGKIRTGSSSLMKSINKRLILDTIISKVQISRSELAEILGLAMPTVMRIVDEMIFDGYAEEIGKGNSTGGRKPTLVSIKPNACYFLGTIISDKITCAVANATGEILCTQKQIADYSQGTESIVEGIKQCSDIAIKRSGVDENKIVYAGIGTPGMNFKYIGRSDYAHYNFWSSCDFGEISEKEVFNCPTATENIAKLGALGELRFGVGKKLKDFLYIYTGTGIGLGVVIGGKLISGFSGVAGEFGHSIVQYRGKECYCGNRGCLETYCALDALISEYERELINNNIIVKQENNVSLDEFVELIEKKNKFALNALKKCGAMLGIGVANVINIYNPEAVIMGGMLCANIPLYSKIAKEEAKKNIFMKEARQLKFLTSEIESKSELLGCIALAMESFFSKYCDGKSNTL